MNKGIYCLILFLPYSKKIKAGHLKEQIFPKGYYCYIGSALNNLDKRIARHKSKEKKLYWHIDYFLNHSKIIGVKRIHTKKKKECELSKKVSKTGGKVIATDFGSSDCNCLSHLYHFNKNPLKNKEFSSLFPKLERE